MHSKLFTALVALLFTTTSWAEFEPYKDYELSEKITHMTTIKVKAGKGEEYLEGLAQTWIESNQIAKDLGHIEDFSIYLSVLPESGDFNVVLLMGMKSIGDFTENEKQYNAFMKKWGERRQKESKTTAKSYPELRTIEGEYILKRVKFK